MRYIGTAGWLVDVRESEDADAGQALTFGRLDPGSFANLSIAPPQPQSAEGPTDTIPGGPFQGRPLAIGGSDTGIINLPGDIDGFRVELVAGQSYVFTLTGSGASPLSDPFLELYGNTTQIIAIDDDAGPGLNSLLRYTATVSGTYWLNVRAWDGDTSNPAMTGGYTVTAAIGPPQDPLDSIDYGFVLPTTNISVYFATAGQTYDGTTASRSWTPSEIASAMAAMATFSAVTNLTFTQVGSATGATFVMSLAELPAGTLGQFDTTGGRGYGVFDPTNETWTESGLQPGGQGFVTLMHEVGHGLGMAHPHDNGGIDPNHSSEIMQGVTTDNTRSWDSYGTFQFNQGRFTVMSYNLSGRETGPGTLDVAFLQQRYGADMTANLGDDVYTITDDGLLYTIWDVGGIDSIVYQGGRQAYIDLRAATLLTAPGGVGGTSYSYGNFVSGFSIANSVVIENATGGSGEDRIHGNDGGNILNGGGNHDTLWGHGGADVLDGGEGSDIASYQDDLAGVVINLLLQTGVDGSGATDTLLNIENVIGSAFNDSIIGGAGGAEGYSVLQGGDGEDYLEDHSSVWGTLIGGNGNDTLVGGGAQAALYGDDGDDALFGSSVDDYYLQGGYGNDYIEGRAGNDGLDGGIGDDTLYGGLGDDYLAGFDGDDVLSGDQGRDNIIGWYGNDIIIVRTGQFEAGESIDGSDGVDTLLTMGLNNDYRIGTLISLERLQFQQLAGELTVNLMINATQIGGTGLVANLMVQGSAAQDSVQVFVGENATIDLSGWTFSYPAWGFEDYIVYVGDNGNETFVGFPGLDVFFGSPGNDSFDGGGAFDFAAYIFSPNAVTVDLAIVGAQVIGGNQGSDTLINIEGLAGSQLNDFLYGNSGANIIQGMYGNDVIDGRGGDDDIRGLEGADTLTGGTGADTFRLTSATESTQAAADTITDFVHGTDHVDLSLIRTGASDTFQLVVVGANTRLDVDLGGNGSIDVVINFTGVTNLDSDDVIWTGGASASVVGEKTLEGPEVSPLLHDNEFGWNGLLLDHGADVANMAPAMAFRLDFDHLSDVAIFS